jgi:dienelactone hydrolase
MGFNRLTNTTRLALLSALIGLTSATLASASTQDVDLTAVDGTALKATYLSPDKPGPAMLLVHQCNQNRQMWGFIAEQLVASGVHVLALDLRGFGDSGGTGMRGEGGFPAFMKASTGDVDLAYDYLARQTGVIASRIAAGGASCGAMLTADLAARKPVTALMLLSGPPSDNAIANIAGSADLAVFAAAATEDPITVGVAERLEGAVEGSPNPNSMAKIYAGTEHGLPMFAKNADLEPTLIGWLTAELAGD